MSLPEYPLLKGLQDAIKNVKSDTAKFLPTSKDDASLNAEAVRGQISALAENKNLWDDFIKLVYDGEQGIFKRIDAFSYEVDHIARVWDSARNINQFAADSAPAMLDQRADAFVKAVSRPDTAPFKPVSDVNIPTLKPVLESIAAWHDRFSPIYTEAYGADGALTANIQALQNILSSGVFGQLEKLVLDMQEKVYSLATWMGETAYQAQDHTLATSVALFGGTKRGAWEIYLSQFRRQCLQGDIKAKTDAIDAMTPVYALYRRLLNMFVWIRVAINVGKEVQKAVCTTLRTVSDKASVTLTDVFHVIACGEVSEVKALLSDFKTARDFASVQALKDFIGKKYPDFFWNTKTMKTAKGATPATVGPLVSKLSRYVYGLTGFYPSNEGGAFRARADLDGNKLRLVAYGNNSSATASYFALPDNDLWTSAVQIGYKDFPSGVTQQRITYDTQFTQNYKVVTWLTDFHVDTSTDGIDGPAREISCWATDATSDGFNLNVKKDPHPDRANYSVGVGWMAFNQEAVGGNIIVKDIDCSIPENYLLANTHKNDLWNGAIKMDCGWGHQLDRPPITTTLIKSFQSYDGVRAQTMFGTTKGMMVDWETRANVKVIVIEVIWPAEQNRPVYIWT